MFTTQYSVGIDHVTMRIRIMTLFICFEPLYDESSSRAIGDLLVCPTTLSGTSRF